MCASILFYDILGWSLKAGMCLFISVDTLAKILSLWSLSQLWFYSLVLIAWCENNFKRWMPSGWCFLLESCPLRWLTLLFGLRGWLLHFYICFICFTCIKELQFLFVCLFKLQVHFKKHAYFKSPLQGLERQLWNVDYLSVLCHISIIQLGHLISLVLILKDKDNKLD